MNYQEVMDTLHEIKNTETPFKKKYLLIKICLHYVPDGKEMKDNYHVIKEFSKTFMPYRILFKKKDEKTLTWFNKFEQYIHDHYETYTNHLDYLIFLHMYIIVGLLKNDKNIVKKVHENIIEYMNLNLMKSGCLKDSYEHDCMTYQIVNMRNLLYIITDLKKFGYYHYNYFDTITISGGTILKSFKYLMPYIEMKKIKFEFLNSIFECDKDHNDYGKLWDVSQGSQLLDEFKSLHKKIEHLNKLFVQKNNNGDSNIFSFHSAK